MATWTPGRYTVETIAGDVVRFIDLVIGRPTLVSGMSSGGVIAAWLSAYAKPGQIRGAVYEDTPLFAAGQPVNQAWGRLKACGTNISETSGDCRELGGLHGRRAARVVPAVARAMQSMFPPTTGALPAVDGQPPQNLKEYDPEWGRTFSRGLATAGCDHATLLFHVIVPVLFTHHYHQQDDETGVFQGAISAPQAERVRQLVTGAGQEFTYRDFPGMPYSMHGHQPALYTRTVTEWAAKLPDTTR